MKLSQKRLLPATLAAALVATLPLIAQADDAPSCGGRFHHHGMMRGEMMGPMGHFDGMDRMPPFVHALKLSEAQRDQIFKIMHDQAPALREKAKEVRQAHADIRALTFSAAYDEAKVKALSETGAQAMAQMAQMRAASANQIYQLLTPEQRKQADALKAEFEANGPRRGMPPADAPAAKRR